MPIPGMSRNDMISIQKREMRTEDRLEKAQAEIARLKAIIKILRAKSPGNNGIVQIKGDICFGLR